MTNAQETTYARELADKNRQITALQDEAKDLMASAKDAGLNVRIIRKAAKELCMEAEKREKIYEDEAQLDLLRDALRLTGTQLREAAE